MNEHLPECCVGTDDCKTKPCQRCHACCICEQLRACEERVLAGDERWIKASTEANHRIAYRLGHDAGLDAAREAVEREWTLDPSWDGTNWNNALTCALAAIDALKEKP